MNPSELRPLSVPTNSGVSRPLTNEESLNNTIVLDYQVHRPLGGYLESTNQRVSRALATELDNEMPELESIDNSPRQPTIPADRETWDRIRNIVHRATWTPGQVRDPRSLTGREVSELRNSIERRERDGVYDIVPEELVRDRELLHQAESVTQQDRREYIRTQHMNIMERDSAEATQQILNTFHTSGPSLEEFLDSQSSNATGIPMPVRAGSLRSFHSPSVPRTESPIYPSSESRRPPITASLSNSFHIAGPSNTSALRAARELLDPPHDIKSSDNLMKQSYEAFLQQLYNIPVTLPKSLILNELRVEFISFEEAAEMLSQNKVSKWVLEPMLQPWAGPPSSPNRIITIFDRSGMTYLVKAKYDQNSNQIYPPI